MLHPRHPQQKGGQLAVRRQHKGTASWGQAPWLPATLLTGGQEQGPSGP